MYLRLAALGDSTTYGIGDPVPGGWREWARLLADAPRHDVRRVVLQPSRVRVDREDVRDGQLGDAVAHRPDVVSLIVGIDDTMRSIWDPRRIRET